MNQNIHGPNWAFKMMSLIHDNSLRRKFSNPYQTLENAGIKSGQSVLEVGCGPGFFTLPCSEITGTDGLVYALDIHPLAIKRVKEKMEMHSLSNIIPIEASATDTGLTEQSIDLAFFFGVPRLLRDEILLKNVLKEIRRVLREKGRVSIKSSRKKLIKILEEHSFSFLHEKNGILSFRKS